MAETPVDFSGKWKLIRLENFDEYADAVGMPWMAKKMASKATPVMDVEQTGNHFKISMKVMMMHNVQEFDVGEEAVIEPPGSGEKFKAIARWEGNKLVIDSSPVNPDHPKIASQTNIRELNGPDETVLTITVRCKGSNKEVTMKRIFGRV